MVGIANAGAIWNVPKVETPTAKQNNARRMSCFVKQHWDETRVEFVGWDKTVLFC